MQEKSSSALLFITGVGLFYFPHIVILFFFGLIFIKRNPVLLFALSIIMVLVVILYPDYALSLIVPMRGITDEFFNIFRDNGSIWAFFIDSVLSYSLVNHFFLIHVILIITLIYKEILEGKAYEILNLSEILKSLKKSEGKAVYQSKKNQTSPDKTIIGHRGNSVIATHDTARHVFICGTTGSGKTVALSNYIISAIKKDYPLFIIDGKGDTGKDSILDIIKRVGGDKKLYVVDINDPSHSAHYNPFLGANPSVMKDMLVNLTTWSEEHYKANTERYLQRLILLLEKAGITPSFKALISYLPPDKLTELATRCYKEKTITKEDFSHTAEIIKASAEIALDASARFVSIAESEVGAIFDENGIDIYRALEENAIILFILNPLLYPELTTSFGRLVLIDAKKAVNSLYKYKKKRVFYIMDEINTYASPVFIDLVNKSRSANVTCIVATQSLSDLDYTAGDAFKEQLIENCNNYIVMRQNSAKNAEEWAKILGTVEGLAVTYQIGEKEHSMVGTGLGTVKKERNFLYHPDDIKRLSTGQAIYMSKDFNEHCKLMIRKGF